MAGGTQTPHTAGRAVWSWKDPVSPESEPKPGLIIVPVAHVCLQFHGASLH